MKETIQAIRTLPGLGRRLLSRLASQPLLRRVVANLAFGAAGFFLAGGSVAGRPMPFSVALIAAAGAPLPALAAMLGNCLGCLWFWDVTGGLEYLAVGVLVFTAVCVTGSADLSDVSWFLPAVTAGMSMLVGLLFLIQSRFAPLSVLWYLLRLGLAAISVWAFTQARQTRRQGCRLYLMLCILSGCASVPLAGGVTLGQVLACAAAAASVGTNQSLLLCAAAGLAVDMAAFPPVSLAALLCFSGLAAMAVGFRSRLAKMLVFLLATTAGIVFAGGQMPELAPAAALGCCLSLLIPQSALPMALAGGSSVHTAARRLEQSASLLEQLRSILEQAVPAPESDAAAIFDRASDQVCAGCPRWASCWQRNSSETYRALCAVARPMLEHGAVTREMFSEDFSDSCCRLDDLMAAVNRELEGMTFRRQYRSRLRESRAVLAQQYGLLGDYLRDAAQALQDPSSPPVAYFPELGACAAGKPGNTVSGDRGASFRSADGSTYFILLCDGMGTGPEAAAESREAVRLLSGLILAGQDPRGALETLNGVYILRGDGVFSTVDLLRVSLVTGEATLYKWGAAPSYYKAGPQTQKIGTAAPPPGFGIGEVHKAEEYQLSLCDGEVLVLLSDGAGGEEAGRRIASWNEGSPKALASSLIAAAQQDGEDDMTALALRLQPCPVLP